MPQWSVGAVHVSTVRRVGRVYVGVEPSAKEDQRGVLGRFIAAASKFLFDTVPRTTSV